MRSPAETLTKWLSTQDPREQLMTCMNVNGTTGGEDITVMDETSNAVLPSRPIP